MVPGIDSFREKFKDYTDYYTIIGGTACDILLSEADLPFRATKDIDMILIMEDNFPEFASIFWEYIKEGGYKCGWKNEQNMHFYRFTEGKFGYPTMIELFSRKPGYHLEIEEGIIPIHIDDDTSSLSAILLNDDFYKFMMSGRRVVDGIGVEELENRLKSPVQINIMHRIDNVLFSHGGLTADFLRWLNKDLLDADIEEVIATVNDAPHDYLWNDKSPLWFRPQYETREMFRADTYKQVVGHTPVEKIFEKDGIISTDVFSTYRDGRQIGESAMIVIDSETGEYEKIEVMGKLGV